jgi:hypothetical protein
MNAPAPAARESIDARAARAELQEHLERLAQQVDSTRRDEGFREALETMARFWRYSVLNQRLIRAQRPQATQVAGRRDWEAVGRKVKPGEPPILVFAPSWRRDGTMRFLGVEVFDLRQTWGRGLATLDLFLPGRTRHAKALEAAAARLGIEVATATLPENVLGRSLEGRIEIVPFIRGRQRASVLAHELAHEILHQAERRRAEELKRPGPARTHAERETEAEATAYVVLAVLGLPSKAPTYIAWQGGTGRGVLRSMNRIQRAAKVILEALVRDEFRRGG